MKITFAICVALLIGFAGKAILYPDMPLDRFAYLGAARISWLVREQAGLLTPYDARDDKRTELANIRAMFPDVSGTDLERALAIRDAVHTRTRIGNSPAGYDRRNLDQFVYLAVEDPDSGFLCQGISDVYVLVMEAFGIQTRRVDLYAKSKNAPSPVESHATVEVKIDGRWIAVDPTYAFSIFHDGQRIDWTEAREIMLSGGKVDFRHDGVKPKIPRIELSRVVRFLVKPDKVLPADWDGVHSICEWPNCKGLQTVTGVQSLRKWWLMTPFSYCARIPRAGSRIDVIIGCFRFECQRLVLADEG